MVVVVEVTNSADVVEVTNSADVVEVTNSADVVEVTNSADVARDLMMIPSLGDMMTWMTSLVANMRKVRQTQPETNGWLSSEKYIRKTLQLGKKVAVPVENICGQTPQLMPVPK
jgi:hypothetical protein